MENENYFTTACNVTYKKTLKFELGETSPISNDYLEFNPKALYLIRNTNKCHTDDAYMIPISYTNMTTFISKLACSTI